MQTPRGFLIGAAAIAAIAAFASVGHPRSETEVHIDAPDFAVAQTPTINASSDDPDIEVLSRHVEAGNDGGPPRWSSPPRPATAAVADHDDRACIGGTARSPDANAG